MKLPGSYAGVAVEFIAAQLEANQMILVDSRPKKPKYDKGHIPSAISIPDSQLDKLKGKLPSEGIPCLVSIYVG